MSAQFLSPFKLYSEGWKLSLNSYLKFIHRQLYPSVLWHADPLS